MSSTTYSVNGEVLAIASSTTVSLTGSSNTLNAGNNDTIGAFGNSNIFNMGSGAVLNIIGSSDTFNVSGGVLSIWENMSNLLMGSSNNVTTGVDDTLNVGGNYNVLNMGSGSSVGLVGSGNIAYMSGGVLNLWTNVSDSLSGTNNVVNGNTGDVIALVSGTNNNVTMSGGSVSMTAGGYVILTGSNDSVTATGTAANVAASGSSDHLNLANGSFVGLNGTSEVITLSSGSVVFSSNNSGTIIGSSDGISTAGTNVAVQIIGSSDNVSLGSGSSVTIASGTNNNVTMSGGSVSMTAGGYVILTGSNDSVTATGTAANVAASGSSDTLNLANGSFVGLNGTSEVITLSSGSVVFSSNNSGTIIGSSDGISTAGTNVAVQIIGSSDNVSLGSGSSVTITGTSEAVTMSSGSVSLSANSSVNLTGSSDNINAAAGSTMTLSAGDGNEVITMNNGSIFVGSLDTMIEVIGTGNTVSGPGALNLSAGITATVTSTYGYIGATNDVIIAANLSGAAVNGSGNTLDLTGTSEIVGAFGANDTVNVFGSNDWLTLANATDVNIASGSTDVISLSSGIVSLASAIVNADLCGSNDQVVGGTDEVVNVWGGSNDTLNLGGGSSVDLVSGSDFVVNMSSSELNVVDSIAGVIVSGSGDTIFGGTGDVITITGNNDIVNMNEGGTVVLSAGDTGDTINMIGGSVVVGTGVSDDTIIGTEDLFGGAGASLVGSITLALTLTGYEGATIVVPGNVPPVVYDNGGVPLLISYFEANPNLGDTQIQGAESDPNYQNELDAYLSNTTVWGPSSTLPSNILAMLEGYSSLDIAVDDAVTGVDVASDLSEAVYIEQQLAWAESTYPIPTDYIQGALTNLMSALISTVSSTQNLVSEAVQYLEDGRAGASQGSQAPMLDDTAASMLLDLAGTSGVTSTTSLGETVYTPDRSAHWDLTVLGDGSVTFDPKSAPFWQSVAYDINAYVTPVVDVIAMIPGPQQVYFKAAAVVLELVQAGEDFASGNDLNGIFSVLGAIGGALTQAQSIESQELAQFGAELSTIVSVAQAVNGEIAGVEQNQLLTALSSALGGVTSVTQSDPSLADLNVAAAVGAGLAGAADAISGGDYLEALAALTSAAADPTVENTLMPVVSEMDRGFSTTELIEHQSGSAGQLSGLNGAGYTPQSGDAVLLARVMFAEDAQAYSSDPSSLVDLGWAIVNRVGLAGFESTLSGVVYQPGQFDSATYDGGNALWNAAANPSTLSGANLQAYNTALGYANQIISGQLSDPTDGATYFYSGATPPPSMADWISSGAFSVKASTSTMTFLYQNYK